MSNEILETDSPETAPQDMFNTLSSRMSQQEIREWLDGLVMICMRHMNSCGEDPESMDEIDESFLMYENAILFMYGQIQVQGMMQQGELH